MSKSPEQIANLLTEDPNVINEGPEAVGPLNWDIVRTLEADEVPIGDDLLYVKFEVGANIYSGEKKVMYYKDGSGYPGSPPSIEWEILDIKEVLGEKEIPLTPEVKEAAKDALERHIDDDDLMEELSEMTDGYRDFP